MKRRLLILSLGFAASLATAADIDAGKAKVAGVCAACHGANGISVADHIPNLAAQRAGYLASQLAALKDGSRKSDIMNVVAAQLSEDDIANVTAYFSSLPGATGSAKSAFLPNLARTNVRFPENYKAGFTRYHTLNVPESAQVKHYYANEIAVAAVRAGKPLPDGAAIFVEVYSAKLDANKKPLTGSDGFFVADQLRAYTTMARDADWGKDIPDVLRNENWNYAIFSADKQLRTTVNQAECLACHVPASKASYVFTMPELVKLRK